MEQTRNVIVVGFLTERIKKKKPTHAKKKNHPSPTRPRRLSSWDTDWDYILDRVVP